VDQGIIDADFPHLASADMPFIIRTPEHPVHGYTPWKMPLNLRAFHWSTLWNNLRKRVPDETYHQGREVVDARQVAPTGVELVFNDAATASFDLVIFADGYRSLGRTLIAPDAKLQYRGYMLWRGLLPEEAMADSAPLGHNVPRLSFSNQPGNLVVYFVPNLDGSTQPGERIYNWASYIPLPEERVPAFMLDGDGVSHFGTLPPGKMRPSEENRLKQLMAENVPDYYAEIIKKTQDTYVQLIYTADIPVYHGGRICLIGDAGMVAQPFTGSGVFKGLNNISALIGALGSSDSLESALQKWGREQVRIGRRLLALGEQMEQALIWNPLDLREADEEATQKWWQEAVTFPEEFTYEDEGEDGGAR
jgi:2-polyprenyl-6-methoxyphenol hydroxylase-like FAD-dependent oxidoreductase